MYVLSRVRLEMLRPVPFLRAEIVGFVVLYFEFLPLPVYLSCAQLTT